MSIKTFKKEIGMRITYITSYEPDLRDGDEWAIQYDYGDDKAEIQWVDPHFGELLSLLSGIKIRKHGEK